MNTSASAVHRSEGDAHQCDWDIARCAVYREKAVLEEIAPHLRAGTIIVDMSTIGPVTTDALAGSQRGAASNSPTPPLDDLPSMRTVVNSYLAIAACELNAETLTLATRFGLDLEQTIEVLNGTTPNNGHLKTN